MQRLKYKLSCPISDINGVNNYELNMKIISEKIYYSAKEFYSKINQYLTI
ncbi:putative thioesterase involved in non-ribosomal peptide biosynthesis (plasmid) [Enterococcus mundtii]|uniref:Thioesterase involved in non-ribosomal peptide biosynthesis n=1 Tax=Enterococcus mundtii TaxID=53346 RepID=A0AAI8RCB3_ENTMU|nr:putative thioesterase involved in non-ribosomal peptide biosynthesis [Enterococcus mundtii]